VQIPGAGGMNGILVCPVFASGGQGGSFRENRPPGPPEKAFILLSEESTAIYTHIVPFNVLLNLSLPILPVNQFRGNDYRHEYDQWKRQVR